MLVRGKFIKFNLKLFEQDQLDHLKNLGKLFLNLQVLNENDYQFDGIEESESLSLELP